MARTTVYLVRHGEQDRSTGHSPDGGLSAVGVEQAGRLGRRLRSVPFTQIHHSPLRRAAQTAGTCWTPPRGGGSDSTSTTAG